LHKGYRFTHVSKLPERNNLIGKFWTFDSYVSSGLFEIWDALKRWGSGYSSFLYRFRLAGLRRVFVGLLDDGLTLGVIFAFGLLAYALPPFSGTGDVWNRGREYAVTFTDANGTVIGRRGIRQNDAITLEDIPPHAIKAVLATEDARFFDHFGVDIIGTTRAIVQNTRANATVQGGSSLTQQVAKNLFLSPERTIRRKIHEAFLALWIEARLSKPEILKLYLDRSYMGGGTYGIEAASQFYFGKSVRDVTLPEAAMLAGLFKAPTKYAPHQNIEAARSRANVVLYRMVAAGYISQGELLRARREPAHVVAQANTDSPDWYLDQAYRDTLAILDEESLNKDFVIEVKTTIDTKLQAASQKIINDVIDTRGAELKFTQAASITMTPEGAVKAIVGGRNYEDSQFNRATSATRQTGSAFKPFVYLAALIKGFKPDQIVVDEPVSIGNWSPRNYSEKYAGRTTLTNALARSYNSIPVKLLLAVGKKSIIQTAHDVGIEGAIDSWPPMVLGTSSLTLLDITRGYATFAGGGKLADPYTVLQIKRPNGDIIYDRFKAVGPAQQAVPEAAVADLNSMLKQVVKAGTARSADLGFAPQGGKTGTNQSYRDAWYIGFTAHNVTGVWVGNDDFSPMEKVTGGMVPAPTWKRIMNVAEQGEVPLGLAGIPLDESYISVAEANFDDPALQPASATPGEAVIAAVATGPDDETASGAAEVGTGLPDTPGPADVAQPAADDPLNNLFSLFEKKVPKPQQVKAPRKKKPRIVVQRQRSGQTLQRQAELDSSDSLFEPLVLPRANTSRRSSNSFLEGLFGDEPSKPRRKKRKKTLFELY
jgi:penicillin-binding protein 1A